MLACGIVNSGVRNECDPALALLSDYVEHSNSIMQVGAILGLGLAYAGSNREDVLSLMLPVISDSKSTMEVCIAFFFVSAFCQNVYINFKISHPEMIQIYFTWPFDDIENF